MKVKREISTDRFSVEAIPIYKQASGIITKREEKIEPSIQKKPINPKKSKPVANNDLVQCTFRLRNDQIKALGLLHIDTCENFSGMVREALETYLSCYLEDKTLIIHISFSAHSTPGHAFKTKGIRLTPELINAIRIVAANNAVEKSEIVRNAIDRYLKQKDAK